MVRKQDDDSLNETVSEIGAAWDDQYDGGQVVEVFADHVIVSTGREYWSVPYVEDEAAESVAFDINSAEKVEQEWTPVGKTFDIRKLDDDQHLVFGWANVAFDKDGSQIEDSQGDIIDADELERAAYLFMLDFREGDEMHTDAVKARPVESMVFTPEKLRAFATDEQGVVDEDSLAVLQKTLPLGWWTGMHVDDPELWGKVKDGTYSAFSIGGMARREEVG